ncbi:DNA gyrase inhibitor YacG [Rubripirellula lacrimiformis]|uniref:DNA gyrase inhibitor YacG n=2 Tax=Rubripirellula lacrimiformis TaxID=1930273 RepID=A0A517NF85_9BACT|nr:DNA gyrase inhibitor YacG [Rubripirellula lacrimiformis]
MIDESPTPPFCSERCQLIDLGRWLDEDISVPHEGGNSDVMGGQRRDDDDSDDDETDDDAGQIRFE